MIESGLACFVTDESLDPGSLARLVEQRGHGSLLFPEHTHIPAERTSPYPPGGELPRRYSRTLDPFVTMAAAAATTTTLRVGTGVCLVVERDPIVTAKAFASVDHLSGGRVDAGVGAGWNREEMRNHGTDPRTRMALMRESVEAMKEIWTSEEASYSGDHVSFERIWSWPKPVQRPHPPVLVGGNGPTVLDRVLAFGDGWLPNHWGAAVIERAAEIRTRAERPVELMVMGVPADGRVLAAYEDAAFSRAVHWLPSAGSGEVERALDGWEAALAELHGT